MSPLSIDARRRLEERLAALRTSTAEMPQDEGEPREVAETMAALERIANGTYGRCQTCGGAVGRQRLLALPATRFCISCVASSRAGH